MTDSQSPLKAIRELIAADCVAEALGQLDALQDAYGWQPEFWTLVAQCHCQRGQPDKAIAALETATTRSPLDIRAQLLLGQLYADAGYRQSAVAIFQHLATLPAAVRMARPVLVRQLGRLGENSLALTLCQQAAAVQPNDWQAWFAQAYYMSQCEMPAERILPVLQRAHELNADQLAIRISLIKVLNRLGLQQEAGQAAAGISVEQIACLRCADCVRQLADLYDLTGDSLRGKACRKRHDDLASDATTRGQIPDTHWPDDGQAGEHPGDEQAGEEHE